MSRLVLLMMLPVACQGNKSDTSDTRDTGDTQITAAYTGWPTRDLSLSEADYRFEGESSGDMAGRATGLGDVDGDGCGDFLVASDMHAGTGEVYLYLSSLLGAPGSYPMAEAHYRFQGEAEEDLAGHSSAAAGDVDADGLDDILVSSYESNGEGWRRGRVYLLLASELGEPGEHSLADSSRVFVGERDNDHMGHSVAGVGDTDGDGDPEILLGAYGHEEDGAEAGMAYLFSASELEEEVIPVVDALHQFTGEAAGDQAGNKLSRAGDVDGDGLADLLISARAQSDVFEDAGRVYVLVGANLGTGGIQSLSDADHRISGENVGDALYLVADAGDVDGDGLDDVLLGAQFNDDGGEKSGKAYLLYGSELSGGVVIDAAGLTAFVGESPGDELGATVQGAGDMDLDGLSDLFLGALHVDAAAEEGGAAYLVLASSLGGTQLIAQSDQVFLGDREQGLAGSSLSSAGDVDGDGLLDLLVGVPMEPDFAFDGTGQVFLLLSP